MTTRTSANTENGNTNGLIGLLQQETFLALDDDDLEIIRRFVENKIRDKTMTTKTPVDTENGTLADEVASYNTDELIEFLEEESLALDDYDLKIIHNRKIDGKAFLMLNMQGFEKIGLEMGPAVKLSGFAKECYMKKNRKGFKHVLSKFGIDGNDTKDIPVFVPQTVKIDDNDSDFRYCIEDIKRKMEIIGPVDSSSDVLRCVYVETILLCSIFIAKKYFQEEISLTPQCEIVGEGATGRADYEIENLMNSKELICVTVAKEGQEVIGIKENIMQLNSSYYKNKKKRKASEAFSDDFDHLYGIVSTARYWYFTMYTPDKVYCTKAGYYINLNENMLENDIELRKGVKKVMEVIVGLLRDKLEINDSPDSKRAKMEKYIKEY